MKNIKTSLLVSLIVVLSVNAAGETIVRRPIQKHKEQTKESKEKVAAWAKYYQDCAKACDKGQWPELPSNPDHYILTVSEMCQSYEPNAEGKTPMVLAFEKSGSGYLCDFPFMSACDACYYFGENLADSAYIMHKLEKSGRGDMLFKHDPESGWTAIAY